MLSEEKITEYIEKLADQLGVAAEHVWEVLTKQMFLHGLLVTIFAGMFFIGGFCLLVFTIKKFKDDYQKDREISFEGFCMGFPTIVILIPSTFFLVEGIKHLLNPEYYALQEILSLFR